MLHGYRRSEDPKPDAAPGGSQNCPAGERVLQASMMIPVKFKMRLGGQQHIVISGKRFVSSCSDAAFHCRLTLRCGALQASGHSDFTCEQLQSFILALAQMVRDLTGHCELIPSECGSVSLRVGVTDTGAIATDVEFKTLTSSAIAHTGWNAAARFHCGWATYYNPIDVACLNVPVVRMTDGHIPIIQSTGDHHGFKSGTDEA